MKKIFERFIFAAVILVLVYTFIDELSRYGQWRVRIRNILIVTGFCFDIIFFLEFSLKSFFSRREGGVKFYFIHNRGWCDFISSFPLLLLDSGPSIIFLLQNGTDSSLVTFGTLGLFKTINLSQIIRTFRYIRVIKLLGYIDITDSKMARHHVDIITTTAVMAVVSVIFIFNLVSGVSILNSAKERYVNYIRLIDGLKRVADMNGLSFRETAHEILSIDEHIFRIEYNGGQIINRIDPALFRKYYGGYDYITVMGRGCTLAVTITDINKITASNNMRNFLIVVFITVLFAVFYAKYFMKNVSDVIRILNFGFRKKNYNLMVKIPGLNEDHEIFRLAKFYNDAYLPAKMKKISNYPSDRGSGLTIKDFDGF